MANLICTYPIILSLVVGSLLFLLKERNNIKILIKSNQQRKKSEKLKVERGLKKGLFIDFLCVPMSIIVLYYLGFIPFEETLNSVNENIGFKYGMLGLIGYSFPFLIIRDGFQSLVLNTLNKLGETLVSFTESELGENQKQV